jgi:hypothetical protein
MPTSRTNWPSTKPASRPSSPTGAAAAPRPPSCRSRANRADDGLVMLHPGQEDGRDPDAAHQHEAGEHQQPVGTDRRENVNASARPSSPDTRVTHSSRPLKLGRMSWSALLEQPVGGEAGEGELNESGQDQASGNQVGDDTWNCVIRNSGTTTARSSADHQDAEDRQHPGPGADDAGVGVGLHQRRAGCRASAACAARIRCPPSGRSGPAGMTARSFRGSALPAVDLAVAVEHQRPGCSSARRARCPACCAGASVGVAEQMQRGRGQRLRVGDADDAPGHAERAVVSASRP